MKRRRVERSRRNHPVRYDNVSGHVMPELSTEEATRQLRRNLILGLLILVVLLVAAIIVGLSVVIFPNQTGTAPSKGLRPSPGPTATFTLEPDSAAYGHPLATIDKPDMIIPAGTTPTFSYYPPASGPHYATGVDHFGFYTDTVPEAVWLNNVAHGAVVLLYQPDLDEQTLSDLRALPSIFPPDNNQVPLLILPYATMSRQLIVVTWGREEEFNTLDTEELLRFYRRYADRGPLNGS